MGYFDEAKQEHELTHHGIFGMKWGVRRFQNKDGSLTPAGRARMNKVSNSKLKSKIDTRIARAVYQRNAEYGSIAAAEQSKKSVKYKEKSSKYAEGTEKHKELVNKSKEAAQKSKEYSILSDLATKKVADIDDGAIKAGRDFIVQKDLNFQITMLPTYKAIVDQIYNPQFGKLTTSNPWIGSNEYRVIEKGKSDRKNDALAENYKKTYSEYVDAEDKFQSDSSSKKVRDAATKADNKQYEAWRKLDDAGYTSKEISKMQKDVLNKRKEK